jgi:hypothetical protein
MTMSEPGFVHMTRVDRIVAAVHEVDRAIDAWDGSHETTIRLRRAMSVQDATQRLATHLEIGYAGMILGIGARNMDYPPGDGPGREAARIDRTRDSVWILWYGIKMQTIDKLWDRILRVKHRMNNYDSGI